MILIDKIKLAKKNKKILSFFSIVYENICIVLNKLKQDAYFH